VDVRSSHADRIHHLEPPLREPYLSFAIRRIAPVLLREQIPAADAIPDSNVRSKTAHPAQVATVE
jgi:hypothetical protein